MKTNTILAILQQSEYNRYYFLKWWQKHENQDQEVEPEKWTLKLSLIRTLFFIFFFLPVPIRVGLILNLIAPFEWLIRNSIYAVAKTKLAFLKKRGLKIVAIAGSFGKTSTKHLIYHSLKNQLQVKITPKSVNTPLGIAQVILQDLSSADQLFIVELGEYHQGDIKELAEFIKPNFGIVTPIGKQHLERMGSLEAIAKTMAELIDYFGSNLSHVLVSGRNADFFKEQPLNYYGDKANDSIKASDFQVSRSGTEFKVQIRGENENYSVFMPIFGKHQAVNLLPAFWLAEQLGLDLKTIVGEASTLPYLSRRHEPRFLENNILILDNSYNTNPDSIDQSLELLNQLEADKRLVVTLGFSELGDQTQALHLELGEKLANQADYVGLIESENSQDIEKGFLKAGGQKDQLVIGQTPEEAFEKLGSKVTANSIILFEGGYREILV